MLENLEFNRVEQDTILKPFDCNCEDLNDYFQNEAINHLKELMSVTYTFEDQDETVAFFSVSNDRISREDAILPDSEKRTFFKSVFYHLRMRIPGEKRHPGIPAVKIGRLGINVTYQGQGVGSEVLDFLKMWFTIGNKTGCRCITVDAYNSPEVLDFYKNNGFEFLNEEESEVDLGTRFMFFDLMPFVNSSNELSPDANP